MTKSALLSPFGWLYGAVAAGRRALYEKGFFESVDLGAPVVSIGNLTVGGTGKTPLVAFAASILDGQGEKVCILTRGYRRQDEREMVLVSDGVQIFADARKAGDEPLELARKLLGKVSVVADADRARAGAWARANLGATAFVLDDAFQHLRVKRDLDLVCIDATNPFGNRKLLPAGILREPVRNLKRAGAIVITRANLVDEKQIADLKKEILEHDQRAKIFVSTNVIAALTDLREFNAKSQEGGSAETLFEQGKGDEKQKGNKFAFCALGNPESFFRQLRAERFDVVATRKFPDHHFYTPADIVELEALAEKNGAQSLLTTAKDAVKLSGLKIGLPCLVAESELNFDDEKGLSDLIAEIKDKRKDLA